MRATGSVGQAVLLAVVFALCVVTRSRAQDCDGWWPIGDPARRGAATMVLDTHRNVVVLYGGNASGYAGGGEASQRSTETWEFDGDRWRFRTLAGPSVRADYAIAFDERRGVTVLFGGTVFNAATHAPIGPNAETWEWDGNAWTQREVTGPSARRAHAMAYDPVNQNIILYGGSTGSSEMWSYDGDAWVQVARAPVWPGDRTSHAMCADPVRGVVVLHSVSQPVMEWDGAEWSTPAPDQILSGNAAVLGFDSSTNRIVGLSSTAAIGTFALWDGVSWTPVTGNIRVPLSHRYCQLPGTAGLMTYGVLESPTLYPSQVNGYRFANGGLSPLTRSIAPPRRREPAMATETSKGRTLLCGGEASGTQPLRDTWELRGERWTFLDADSAPTTTQPGMIYDEAQDELLLTGVATYRRTNFSWQPILGSSGANQVDGTGYSLVHGPLVFVDGSVRRWTGTRFVAFGSNSGLLTIGINFTFDPVRSKGIAIGNASFTRAFDPDTLTWSTLIAQTQTSNYDAEMVYDASRGGVVLFGGFRGAPGIVDSYQNRTYFLPSAATNWQDLALRAPMGRKLHSMTYDPVSERIILFGGVSPVVGGGHEYYDDTWILSRGPAAIARQPANTAVRLGHQAELFVIAKGGGPIKYQWRRDGEVIYDSARFSGTDRDTFSIVGSIEDDEGAYTCTVTNACGTQTSDPATLTVHCHADLDNNGDFSNGSRPDGAVTIDDLVFFLAAFEALDLAVDLDNGTFTGMPDNAVDINDLLYFLVRFEEGC